MRLQAVLVAGVLAMTACSDGGGASTSGPKTFSDTIASDLSNLIVHDVEVKGNNVLLITVDAEGDFGLNLAVLTDDDYVDAASEAGARQFTLRFKGLSLFSDADDPEALIGDAPIIGAIDRGERHAFAAVPIYADGKFRIVVGGENGEGGRVTIHTDTIPVAGSADDVFSRAIEELKSQ